MTKELTAGEAVNMLRGVPPRTPIRGIVHIRAGHESVELVPAGAMPKPAPKPRSRSAKREGADG